MVSVVKFYEKTSIFSLLNVSKSDLPFFSLFLIVYLKFEILTKGEEKKS